MEIPSQYARVNILGVGVNAIDIASTVNILADWIERKKPGYICVTGVHGIMESQRDRKLRKIHNSAALVTPDGMPLVWLCKLNGYRSTSRVYGPNLMLSFCAESITNGYRHYFYGGQPGVAKKLSANLVQMYPGIKIAGCFSPPFHPVSAEEDCAIVEMINKTSPDIIWVGISTPKQEFWMADHVERLNSALLVGVGAAFDFNSGNKKQAPHWMQSAGLEWFFRLLMEPRRLWRRYLTNNPLFIILIIAQSLRIRKYEID